VGRQSSDRPSAATEEEGLVVASTPRGPTPSTAAVNREAVASPEGDADALRAPAGLLDEFDPDFPVVTP
jgi:hypothetical protein